jgi:hypothetical protein
MHYLTMYPHLYSTPLESGRARKGLMPPACGPLRFTESATDGSCRLDSAGCWRLSLEARFRGDDGSLES